MGNWKWEAVSTSSDILGCTDIQGREIGKNWTIKIGESEKWGGARTQTEDRKLAQDSRKKLANSEKKKREMKTNATYIRCQVNCVINIKLF